MIGGYAAAFRDAEIAQALVSGPAGASALAMLFWSGLGAQEIAIPWRVLTSPADVAALAEAIEALPRRCLGRWRA